MAHGASTYQWTALFAWVWLIYLFQYSNWIECLINTINVMGCDDSSFTRPTGPFLSEWAKCQPRNIQNFGSILPIMNLMADSESESPSYYSQFIVTMGVSCLVRRYSRVTDWWTERQTTWTITIAGPNIVACQLIIQKLFEWHLCVFVNEPMSHTLKPHPSTSEASSDYWWRSGVKEGTLTQLL